jgi:hypothetical protein
MEGINGMIATASGVAAYYAVLARVTLGSGTMEYNWIYILIGIGIIIGAGISINRWLSARAVREDKLDRLLTEVTPNGGGTMSIGDTVARTESKVDALIVTVATQKGHTDAVEREVYRRIDKLETREQVNARTQDGGES